ALRVLPGTHMKGVLTDNDMEELAGAIPPIDGVVPQGGVLAMRPADRSCFVKVSLTGSSTGRRHRRRGLQELQRRPRTRNHVGSHPVVSTVVTRPLHKLAPSVRPG